MKNLLENIKIAEQEIKEAEERREVFVIKYRETGDKLYKELAKDEEGRIMRRSVALSEAYIKVREGQEI